MKLIVKRLYRKADYTIGKLYINNEYICDTLEDTDRGLRDDMPLEVINRKKVYGQTAIPLGKYIVDMTTVSNKYKDIQFYKDLCGGRVPRVLDVKGFSGILIHTGNKPEHTYGCLLVGQNRAKGQVLHSKTTFTSLYRNYLLPAHKRGEIITIEYTY